MAFGKFVRDLLHIKLEEGSTDNERQSTAEPGKEVKPEPSRGFLWFLFFLLIFGNIFAFVYFGFATFFFLEREEYICSNLAKDSELHEVCGLQLCHGYGCLAILYLLVYISVIYFLIFKPLIGRRLHREYLQPADNWWMEVSRTWVITIILFIIAMALVTSMIAYEGMDRPEKLIGIVGPIFYIAAGWLFSTNRSAIKWRIVVTGIFCQFALGVFCLRWSVGRAIFECFGSKVATFLGYTAKGSIFVFSEMLVNAWVFAFAVLPVIFFFSFFVSILYYLGAMQWIVMKLGWILQQVLGTTVCESVCAAGNIFLGMSETPLLIRPYLQSLTTSEIHAIMVSGFATVAGTVLAAYMSFGASPAHLITASVMAAPGALAFAKLYLPETEETQTSTETIELKKSEDESLLGAAASGCSIAIPIVLGITANIVAFLGFIAFVNALVQWLCLLVNVEGVNFEYIFSRLFLPIAWAMGIPWEDCDLVAQARSTGITTYAICGFANPGSLGILIAALCSMSPTSKSRVVTVAIRAVVVGSIVSFVSASFIGLLLNEEMEDATYQRIFENLGRPRGQPLNDTVPEPPPVAPPPTADGGFF